MDLSGPYADCRAVGQKGAFTVNRETKDGSSIGGLIDSEEGREGHVNAVNAYLAKLLRRWSRDPDFSLQVEFLFLFYNARRQNHYFVLKWSFLLGKHISPK